LGDEAVAELTVEHIEANRAALLAALDARARIVRDMIRSVGRGYATGFYLYGPAGTAKTHTVRGVLESELKVPYVYRRGHLTPIGLFELLNENREGIIVLDDVGSLFAQAVAVQILLAALEQPKTGRERRITYKRMGSEESFGFRGGLIGISNLELHDAGLLQALKSRVNTLHYDPPSDQMAALMLTIAAGGWPSGGKAVTPAEASQVARHVIAETLRRQVRMDLRVFVDKALPLFVQFKDDEAESHWEDLVVACIEEACCPPRHEVEPPASRAARSLAETKLALEIYNAIPSPEERIRVWKEKTNKSGRAFYRRLDDARGDAGAETSNVSKPSQTGGPPRPSATREEITFVTHDLGDGHLLLKGTLPERLVLDGERFEALWAMHPAEFPAILMHGKPVQTPRWQQAYGRDYAFAGTLSTALPVPPLLGPLLAWARESIDARINGLLVNWYDGSLGHYIGPHHDDVRSVVDGSPIVTVSFGETRDFRLSGGGEDQKPHDFPAPPGTVFVLPYDTNLAWKHSVPKKARYKGRRVSATFRAFQS
jgi:alkylated DNA repair dioxygenase AlkB